MRNISPPRDLPSEMMTERGDEGQLVPKPVTRGSYSFLLRVSGRGLHGKMLVPTPGVLGTQHHSWGFLSPGRAGQR